MSLSISIENFTDFTNVCLNKGGAQSPDVESETSTSVWVCSKKEFAIVVHENPQIPSCCTRVNNAWVAFIHKNALFLNSLRNWAFRFDQTSFLNESGKARLTEKPSDEGTKQIQCSSMSSVVAVLPNSEKPEAPTPVWAYSENSEQLTVAVHGNSRIIRLCIHVDCERVISIYKKGTLKDFLDKNEEINQSRNPTIKAVQNDSASPAPFVFIIPYRNEMFTRKLTKLFTHLCFSKENSNRVVDKIFFAIDNKLLLKKA